MKFIFPILASLAITCTATISASESNSAPDNADIQAYEAMLDSTDNYIRVERWADAARCIRRNLSMRPASPLNSKLFANLGICLTHTGDYHEAMQALDIALVGEPSSSRILYSRASLHALIGNSDSAISDLNAAIRSDSLHHDSLRLRGMLLLGKNNIPSAKNDFNIINANYPDDPAGPGGLGICLAAENQNSDAIKLLKQAITLNPENPQYHLALIRCQIAENKLSDAEESIHQGIKSNPRCGELYMLRGVLHRMLYQNSEAEIDKKIAKEYGVDPQTLEQFLPSAAGKKGK